MKETTIEQFARDTAAFLDAAQRERVLITRAGKPVAVVIGLENKDEEDLELEASADFWRMIEERRREPTIPLDQVKAELFADDKSG